MNAWEVTYTYAKERYSTWTKYDTTTTVILANKFPDIYNEFANARLMHARDIVGVRLLGQVGNAIEQDRG